MEHPNPSMLTAIRKSDGRLIFATAAQKPAAPFVCPECKEVVVLRKSSVITDHFAHAQSGVCTYSAGESESHRRCKLEIYQSLLNSPRASNVYLERSLGTARPDVSAIIKGIPVAIEVQISNLSLDTIIKRTQEYARKGIYVLWLLQWTPYLDGNRYTPRLWEKWIHAAYFGRVYYWLSGLRVIEYRFDPYLKTVPKRTWHSRSGKRIVTGGYVQRLKRYREPARGRTLNLVSDFNPRDRDVWQSGKFFVPAAKLLIAGTLPSSSL